MSSISIDPIILITNEIGYVTFAMRKNARWANSGVASILGIPASDEEEYESLASRFGLRTLNNNSIGVVSLLAETSEIQI